MPSPVSIKLGGLSPAALKARISASMSVVSREAWPEPKGTKEDVCFSVAEREKPEDLTTFIAGNLSCCKQHVYIFDYDEAPALTDTLPGGERVYSDRARTLYVVRTRFTLVLRNPLEEMPIDFLWPVEISLADRHMVVRFVSLEKNFSAYLGRASYIANRSVEESTILSALWNDLHLNSTDIHKGIKTLWENGFMDSPRPVLKNQCPWLLRRWTRSEVYASTIPTCTRPCRTPCC